MEEKLNPEVATDIDSASGQINTTPVISEHQQSDLAVADLVDRFLDENPVDAETIAQTHEELLQSDLSSGLDVDVTPADQTIHEELVLEDIHEEDIDIEVDIEIVDITISDMVDTSSANTVDDYSSAGV